MKRFLIFNLSICLLVAMTSIAMSDDLPTPEKLNKGKVISVEEAKAFFDGKATLFFDVRSPINYGRGHIPAAISFPYKGNLVKSNDFEPPKTSIDISRLPADKDELVVFYSHGPTGWKSYFAATIAIKMGHKNVRWLREGFSRWEEKGHPVQLGKP